MRDRGVAEQALHVGLLNRASRLPPRIDSAASVRRAVRGEHAVCPRPSVFHQRSSTSSTAIFAHRGEEGAHRRRRAVVDVGGPQVERRQRELERDARPASCQAHGDQRRAHLHGARERGECERAGLRVDQRHAEQQQGRGRCRQHQVLDRWPPASACRDRCSRSCRTAASTSARGRSGTTPCGAHRPARWRRPPRSAAAGTAPRGCRSRPSR
jgi:hypothetical protein